MSPLPLAHMQLGIDGIFEGLHSLGKLYKIIHFTSVLFRTCLHPFKLSIISMICQP